MSASRPVPTGAKSVAKYTLALMLALEDNMEHCGAFENGVISCMMEERV